MSEVFSTALSIKTVSVKMVSVKMVSVKMVSVKMVSVKMVRTLNRMVPMTAKMDRTSTLMNRIFHIDLIDDSNPVTTTCRVQEQTYSTDTALFVASVTHVVIV